MARAPVTVQPLTVAGLTGVVYSAPNGAGPNNGNTYLNDGRTVLLVKNASAGTINLTVKSNGSKPSQGVAAADILIPVLTLKDALVWVPPAYYQDSTGATAVDIDTITSVTIAAIQMPAAFA